MEDESPIVQIEAAESGVELLSAIEVPIILGPTDFKIFQLYILPVYQKLGTSQSYTVKATLIKLLGQLCVIGRTLIEQGIINQNQYFLKSEITEEQKNSIENKSISNLDVEIEEIASVLRTIIFDASVWMPRTYQSEIVRQFDRVVMLIGRRNFEAVVTLIISMLNTKEPRLVEMVFHCAPSISEGTGIGWIKDLLACFDMYMKYTEELVIYNIIKCFTYFASSNLLINSKMVSLYKKFSSFLVHPNKWLRTAAIEYCEAVGNCLKNGEVFLYIRPLLQGFLKNFLIVTNTKQFQNFLIQPLSRIVIDLIEARVTETLNHTRNDELAKVMIEKEINLKEINAIDASSLRKEAYKSYNTLISLLSKKLTLFSINIGTQGLGVMEGYFTEIPKNVYQYQLSNEFKIPEEESKEYTDQYYISHKVSMINNFCIDNNGRNTSNSYSSYIANGPHKDSWKFVFESESLCKALSIINHSQPKLNSSVNSKHKPWKPQGRLMITLNTHKAPVYAIDKSDDTTFMATGSTDGTCCVWNLARLKTSLLVPILDSIKLQERITSIKFLDNSYSFGIGTNKGTLEIYRIDSLGIRKVREVLTDNEGGIVNCSTYEGVIIYATQYGGIHVHDVRVKDNINGLNIDGKQGFITSGCIGHDSNYFVGSVNGYILNYDIRFNLVTSVKRYSRNTPIMDMCIYMAEKSEKNSGPVKEEGNPMLFIASGGEDAQVDLCGVNKDMTYWSFVVGNSKLAFQSYSPYILRTENIGTNILIQLGKDFHTLKNIEKRHNEVMDNNYEFKNFYNNIKQMYNSNSLIYKILCPHYESSPFLLTAGADRIVRYWHLGNLNAQDEMRTNVPEMIKQSFIFTSPDNREVEYLAENFGEKVIYERLLRDKGRSNPGIGQSNWQTINGISHLKQSECKVYSVGHTDAILNMQLLDFPSNKFLVTCGRDNLVKLWI